MNCWRIQNLVAAFLDGALGREEELEISEHLEACSECKALVEGVASLPELPYKTLDEDLEEAIFDGFEETLAERIRESVIQGVGIYGHEAEADVPKPSEGYRDKDRTTRVEQHISPPLVLAYVAALLLLAGGVAWNYLQVERLEESVAQRDKIIDTLQRRLVTIDLEREMGFDFAESGLSSTGPVFMPAAAPQALPPASLSGFPNRGDSKIQPSPYRQVSLDGLRVIR